MKYKLISGSTNNINEIKTTVLNNRGIENINEFININPACRLHYELLNNIVEAAHCLIRHIENNSNIHIVVDCDADGICSAAMLYQYLKKHKPLLNIKYSLHTGKQHGLSEDIMIPPETNLIIIPDAGSNDFEQHKRYKEQGINIVVLDHHEVTHYSENAVIVNNQLSARYTNKSLSGAGVTYKFLQALDDELWNDDADSYLDLVAISNIGDVMDSRSLETRSYMIEGLKRVKSNAVKALYDKVSDRMGEQYTLIGVAFYIIPLINAMMRVGTQEQKESLFKAFCNIYSEHDYTKRDKTVIKETVYEKAARECCNAKARQDRQKLTISESVSSHIEKNKLNENQIILCNVDDLITSELIGLVCTEIAKKYRRPALLYRTRAEEINGKKVIIYKGSGRNYDGYELTDFRTFLRETELLEYVDGHANAFGFAFKSENEIAIIDYCNKKLADHTADYTYYVDFITDFEDLDDGVFCGMDKIKNLWGQKVEEPLFAILDVDVSFNKININEGKAGTTVKFEVDGITFIRFKVDKNDELLRICRDWEFDEANAKINVIGQIGINSFGGIKSKQVIVNEWEFIKQ